jgi:hypothetical protein
MRNILLIIKLILTFKRWVEISRSAILTYKVLVNKLT